MHFLIFLGHGGLLLFSYHKLGDFTMKQYQSAYHIHVVQCFFCNKKAPTVTISLLWDEGDQGPNAMFYNLETQKQNWATEHPAMRRQDPTMNTGNTSAASEIEYFPIYCRLCEKQYSNRVCLNTRYSKNSRRKVTGWTTTSGEILKCAFNRHFTYPIVNCSEATDTGRSHDLLYSMWFQTQHRAYIHRGNWTNKIPGNN